MFGFGKRRRARPYCAAVVPAAGVSRRMDGQDKLLLTLGDIPVLARTLQALDSCPAVDEIVVVTRGDMVVPVSQLCKEFGCEKVCRVVTGGESRLHSVLAGVREVSAQAELIAVHDGARPFVTAELVQRVVDRAAQCGAAAPAVPIRDTVKRVADGGQVAETLPREALRAVQTPQVFEASLLKAALQKAVEEGAPVTDDCSAVERLGMSVTLVEGSEENIKITSPIDIYLGVGILNGRGEFV